MLSHLDDDGEQLDDDDYSELVLGEVVYLGTNLQITKCTNCTYIPQPCARRAHRNPPTYIYSPIVGRIYPIPIKTSQELRMLSSVTINCQVTNIVINPGSQLSILSSVSQISQVPMITPVGCSLMEVHR